jgi:hypothetical protein
MEWFSCTLVFEMRMSADASWGRRLQSLMVIVAKDWDDAFLRAKDIGLRRTEAESFRTPGGVDDIVLTFRGVESLDCVGAEIADREVWCSLSEIPPGSVVPELDKYPGQTI